MNLIDVVEKKYANPNAKTFAPFKTGDTVEVAVRIKEGEKLVSRISKVHVLP